MKLVKTQCIFMNTEKRVRLIFNNEDKCLTGLITKIAGCEWGSCIEDFHIPYYENFLICLNRIFPDEILFLDITRENNLKFYIDSSSLPIVHDTCEEYKKSDGIRRNAVIAEFREGLKECNYSPGTISQYSVSLNKLLDHSQISSSMSGEMIKSIIDEIAIENAYSKAVQDQIVNAVRAWYRVVHNIDLPVNELAHPRRDRTKPERITENELEKLINSIVNIKHRILIMLMYYMDISLNEALSINMDEVNLKNHIVSINGRNKRQLLIPLHMLRLFNEYLVLYVPVNFLFEGRNGGRYTARAIQKAMKSGLNRAGITRKLGVHNLKAIRDS